MKAIILAAGMGKRLLPWTALRPKVLVEVLGTPILIRLLRQLRGLGVKQATVVLGDRAEQVRRAVADAHLGLAIEEVHNPRYETTNNAYSLSLCGHALREGALLIEGDVVAHTRVLETFVRRAPAPGWLVRPFLDGMDGALLQADATGRLSQLEIVPRGRRAPRAGFKSMGLLKLSAEYGAQLARWLDAEISGRVDRYYDWVVADHVAEAAPALFRVDDDFWAEIDTPEDLATAERGVAGDEVT